MWFGPSTYPVGVWRPARGPIQYFPLLDVALKTFYLVYLLSKLFSRQARTSLLAVGSSDTRARMGICARIKNCEGLHPPPPSVVILCVYHRHRLRVCICIYLSKYIYIYFFMYWVLVVGSISIVWLQSCIVFKFVVVP